ncbi:MAG TPA: ABC transporter substrate-binding protein [Balneolaceae bacterium]|nr:ABC transporter substrate-binding protein [Balneolaceae bacterium]
MTKKYLSHLTIILAATIASFIVVSCSTSSNTIVVKNAPVSSQKPDTTAAQNQGGTEFQELTIGENQPIHSLDPLFIENTSEMQAVQLVYEGLVRYDASGKIIPAMARSWTVSDNHKIYRFTLKHNLFYQDSDVFSSGRGRRVVAGDIKKDFQRMATDSVPDHAARLFMDIRGFEPYYQEQHKVFRKSARQLHGISGIKVENDSTIVFSLVQPDDHFLQKLASPFAVIYPPESAKAKKFEAVGTGPFRFSQQRSDSLYIFARFNNYSGPKPKLNRVDMVTSGSEKSLLKAVSRGQIDLLPELGPQQIQQISNASGNLKKEIDNNLQLIQDGGQLAYILRYNSGADTPESAVTGALSSVQASDFFQYLPPNSFRMQWLFQRSQGRQSADSLSAPYTGSPFLGSFYSQLSSQLKKRSITFSMDSSRVRNRNIPIYADRFFEFSNRDIKSADMPLLRITFTTEALVRKSVRHVPFNKFNWWIDLRNTTTSSSDSR